MAFGLLAALAFAVTATAQTASRIALFIGNSAYPSLPAIPGCLETASVVADQLRRAGFDVSERTGVSIGAMGAALNGLARRLAGTTDGSAVVYICGYAAEFEGRPFLMPATAMLDRLSDVLAQGIAMRSVPDLVARNSHRGLIVLDLFAGPGASVDSVGRFLGGLTLPAGQIVAASVADAPAPGVTPLAQALVSALRQNPDAGPAAMALRSALEGQPGSPRFFIAGTPALPTPPLPQQPGIADATTPASAIAAFLAVSQRTPRLDATRAGALSATPLPAEVVARAQAALTQYIGPIARILATRSLPQAKSVDELWTVLAQHIDRPGDRQAFLAQRGK